MRIEQVLTEALRDEGESRDVDVPRLWARTQDRLDEQPRRARRLPALAAAAAAVAVVAGVAGLTQVDWAGDNGPAGPDTPARSAVDDEFTCARQATYDWTQPGTYEDDYYIPSLHGGAVRQAQNYRASSYEFEKHGDQAFLRFGNADGTLGLVTEFHREDGKWEPFRTETCSGEAGNVTVPTRGEWRLENHGGEPLDASMVVGVRPQPALLVDDRSYYDGAGLVRHRSMYAHRCRKGMCLTSGNLTGGIGTSVQPGTVPRDVTSVFLPPDEHATLTHPYGLWALYDVEGEVSEVTADLRHGGPVHAQRFYDSTWPGQLHVLLAPFDEVVKITVRSRPHSSDPDAPAKTFAPEQLPGYDDPSHP